MASPKQHERANTYEGPQMCFKFPSEEDFQKSKLLEPEAPLEGPKVKPFVDYQKSKSPVLRNSEHHIPAQNIGIVKRSRDSDHFSHSKSSYSAVSTTSSHRSAYSFAPSNLSECTIPTQSNATTQISRSSESLFRAPVDSRGGTVIRHPPSAVNQSRSGSIRRTTSIMQRRQLAETALRAQRSGSLRKTSSVKISRTPSLKRHISVGSNEDTSLYDRAFLKRSKALRYTVGWLSRLRQKMRKGLKKWRFVSWKKAFKFTRSNSKVKKNNISMPLERDRAQSISELRRAIDDWSRPNDLSEMNAIPTPPTQQFRVSSTSQKNSATTAVSRLPPPVPPPHRIASNKSMQRLINDQVMRESSPRALSIYSEQPALIGPMDQQYRTLSQQPQSEENYPSHPPTIYDDDSTGFVNNTVTEDVENDDSECETLADDDDEEYQERMLREYWRHYLRGIVANRIETKLEFFRLSQIPGPKEHQDAAEEIFGSLSDLDGGSEYFESGNDDTDSLTSMSSSTDVSESSSILSRGSTNYFSAYDGPTATPLKLMRYQMEYDTHYRDIAQVKRASTLPINKDKEYRHNAIELSHQHHMRFLSVIN